MNTSNNMSARAGPLPLRAALRRIILGGSLFMIYAAGTGSPATTEFFRALGANELHFGLLAGIPMVLLSLQFLGAAVVNRKPSRKPTFMVCLIAGRLAYLPLAFLPILMPGAGAGTRVTVALALISLSAALQNYAVPFWLSWAADLVPRRILNRFWGVRQSRMHATWTVAYLAMTLYLLAVPHTPYSAFAILAGIAVVAGVSDVLQFIRVPEPPNLRSEDGHTARALLEPVQHPEFRSFVAFSCFWSFATAFAAAFMQLYVLKILELDAWRTTLIWCLAGVGVAVSAPRWGRLADRHGHRPVINLCVACKSMIAIVFLLLTRSNVMWLLPISFLFDGMLNSGSMVATNGYMLSIAPQKNRSMFIATIMGLSGIVGGVSAMLAGALIRQLGPGTIAFWGRSWNAYHAIFAISLILRWLCIPAALRIREPEATHTSRMLRDLLLDNPLRFLRFPQGMEGR